MLAEKNEELLLYILRLYLEAKVVDLVHIQASCRALRNLLNSDVATFLWKYEIGRCSICYERECNAEHYFMITSNTHHNMYCKYWKGAAIRVRTNIVQYNYHDVINIKLSYTPYVYYTISFSMYYQHYAVRKLRAQWGSHTAIRILVDTTKEQDHVLLSDSYDHYDYKEVCIHESNDYHTSSTILYQLYIKHMIIIFSLTLIFTNQ